MRETNASEPPIKHRNLLRRRQKPGSPRDSGISLVETCLPARRRPVYRGRDSHLGFRTELGNLIEDAKGKCSKRKKRKAESTDASIRGGPPCSSDEAAVMAVERRGWAVQFRLGQPAMGGTLTLGRKAPAFHGLHEPDDARASRPESVSGWRCNSSGRLGNRLAGAGTKPPPAAVVKSHGRERGRKGRAMALKGTIFGRAANSG